MPMKVPPDYIENPEIELLPVEELVKVDGIDKMVKCQYFGQISSSKEAQAKTDNSDYLKITHYLKITLQVNRPKDVLYIDDILTYKKPMVRRLAGLANLLNLKEKALSGQLEADDFLGRWIVFTVRHEPYSPTSGPNAGKTFESNKIDEYIREATPAEIEKLTGAPGSW